MPGEFFTPPPEQTEPVQEQPEKSTPETLDPAEAEAVRDWSHAWLENIFEHGLPETDRRVFIKGDIVSAAIADIVGENTAFQERRLPPRYTEGVNLFLQELIAFVKEKSKETNPQQLAEFQANIQDFLFSYSPSLANHLPLGELLITTAKANRVPEAQGWFGQTMIGELAYELAYCNESAVAYLVKKTKNLPLTDVIDIIHQAQTVGATALAQGEWADPAVARIKKIIQQLQKQHDSPLVNYAAELSLERLEQEEENPTLGVLVTHGDRGQGRLPAESSESLTRDHQHLGTQINVKPHMYMGALGRIAKDAVGVFDHSFLPRKFGKVDFESLKTENEISLTAVRNSLVLARHPQYRSPNRFPYLVAEVRKEIMSHDERAPQHLKTPKDLIDYLTHLEQNLSQKLPAVSAADYDRIADNSDLNPFAQSKDEDLALLLQHLHRPEMRAKVEEDLGLKLTELPLRSQIHLLRFLAGQNRSGFDRLRGALHRHPELAGQIANSFLACAEDMKYADHILKLAETLEQKTLETVLKKYSEIAAATEHVREYLQTTFRGKDITEQRINEVVRRLLHKANELLAAFSQKTDRDQENVLTDLENIKTETLVFADTFKAVSSEHEISFQDIEDTELTQKDSAALTADERQTMLAIFQQNRSNYPPALLQKTTADFRQALASTGKEFFVLRHGGEILAFIRFDELKNGHLYSGSLNVRPETKGSALGSAMLRATLDEKARDRVIEAVAYTKIPMVAHYLGEFGFVAKRLDQNFEDTGQAFFELERDDQKNSSFASRALTEAEIIARYQNGSSSDDLVIHKFSAPDDPILLAISNQLLKNGEYILTRYINGPKNKPGLYLVFEKSREALAQAA